jgi:hypothetical protein
VYILSGRFIYRSVDVKHKVIERSTTVAWHYVRRTARIFVSGGILPRDQEAWRVCYGSSGFYYCFSAISQIEKNHQKL